MGLKIWGNHLRSKVKCVSHREWVEVAERNKNDPLSPVSSVSLKKNYDKKNKNMAISKDIKSFIYYQMITK